MEDIAFLKNISIFSHLKHRDLKRITKQIKRLEVPAGEVIIEEGEKGSKLYIVVRGSVEVLINRANAPHHLQVLGPQSYFGEMALWDNFVRSASVVARQDTELMYLDKFDLRKAIEKYPGLAIELLQMMNRRMRAMEKILAESNAGLSSRCACCGDIRTRDGQWVPLEQYIAEHSVSDLSKKLCPRCSTEKR